MASERNKLRGGVASLLKRDDGHGSAEEVALVRRSGRPSKERPSEWNSQRDCRTSIVMDRDQHNAIRKLANECGVTFKQAMYLLLEEGLTRHDSGELRIGNPR